MGATLRIFRNVAWQVAALHLLHAIDTILVKTSSSYQDKATSMMMEGPVHKDQ